MTIEKVRPRCFLDIEIDGQNTGRIIIELFADVCPLTCDNFRALCTGEKGVGKTTNKPLHYKGVPFHRIVKNFIIQSGDFISGNGTGGESIYGGTFKDENFEIKHDKPFLLSMANKGKDTNGSQFFITTQPAPHLDGKHTVFGHVISGQQVVIEIENQKTTNSRPLKEVIIANCGELVLKVKQKAKKVKSETELSTSSPFNDRSRSKKKKKSSRKIEKKNKKEKREKLSSRVDSVLKHEDTFDCSVDPDEIPEVPANNFLMRRSPTREGNQKPTNRQTGFVFARKPALSRSGRKIKGRGLMRYRTPSSSGSRSGSETPPHWRQAQARVVSLDKVVRKVSKLDRSRSGTPALEDDIKQEMYQKADDMPLRQRIGRKIDGSRVEENNEQKCLKSVSSDFQRSRGERSERQRWGKIRDRNDHSSDYRRDRHSANERESDSSEEGRYKQHSFRSMVVKADTEKHAHNEEREKRPRRSPIRRERQRTADHWQHRSDEFVDIRLSKNQNLENSKKGRLQKEISNKGSAGKYKHENEKEERRSHKDSNIKRSFKKNDHAYKRSSRNKVSASSESDADKRRKRRKEMVTLERDSTKAPVVSTQYLHDNSSGDLKNRESPRSENECEMVPKSEEPEIKNKIRKSSEREKDAGSLEINPAAYTGEVLILSESENDSKGISAEVVEKKLMSSECIETITSQRRYIEKENLHSQTSVTSSDEVKHEFEKYSSSESLNINETSKSLIQAENDIVTTHSDEVQENKMIKMSEDIEVNVQFPRNSPLRNYDRGTKPQSEFLESLDSSEERAENSLVKNTSHKNSDEDCTKSNKMSQVSIFEKVAAVPESSSSPPPFEENEVTSSVENDKLILEKSTNVDKTQEVDYTSIPLDVIPLPEETPPFISTDGEQDGEERKGLFTSSMETRETAGSYVKPESLSKGKGDVISLKDSGNRSRSNSFSSAEMTSLSTKEFPAIKDFHRNEESQSKANENEACAGETEASKAADDGNQNFHHHNVNPMPSISGHNHGRNRSKSDCKIILHQDKKSVTEAGEPVHSRCEEISFSGESKTEKFISMRSSLQSSREHKSKTTLPIEHRPSTSYNRKSPHKCSWRRSSLSPNSDRRSGSIDRRSKSPARSRRSPAGRSSSPSPPRRGYRKSKSPLKSKSPRRRSRSSSRSPSIRRSRSRSRSPVRRRYSRSPDRRYYRRSWSRSYDGRSRFPRYPRLRNKSPSLQYSRPYGRDDRMRPTRRSPRSRSRSRSEIDPRRKRRQNHSSSSGSSSESSSSSSDKKQSKKKNTKKKQKSSSSSTSSRSSST